MYYKARGIILKKTDIGEADKILTIYTQEYGKIRCVATGVRRPKSKLAGHVDALNLVAANLVHGKSLDRLTGCQAEETFAPIKREIDATAQVYLAVEFFDHVVELNQKDELLFDVLENYLRICAREITAGAREKVRTLTWALLIKTLDSAGVMPATDRCAACQRAFDASDVELFTNQAREGFWCAACKMKIRQKFIRVDIRVVKALRFFVRSVLARVPQLEFSSEVAELIDGFVRALIELHVRKSLISPGIIRELSVSPKTDILHA